MPPYRPIEERFWEKVNKDGPIPENRPELGPCWIWTAGANGDGYGKFTVRDRVDRGAHRVGYQLIHGELPNTVQMDHLCRNHSCVNPAHLEPVTPKENSLRGMAPTIVAHREGVCMRGHPMIEGNVRIKTDGGRQCLTCKRAADRKRNYRARVAKQKAAMEADQTAA